MEQDKLQKITEHREPQTGERRQKVFCDITWEHPTEFSKPGRSLHVTEEAVYTDSSKWSYFSNRYDNTKWYHGNSAFVIHWIARAFFYIY